MFCSPSSLCQVAEIIEFVQMPDLLPCFVLYFSFKWSQQTISFWFSMHVSFNHTSHDVAQSVGGGTLSKSPSKSIHRVYLANEWLICELTCDYCLLSPRQPALGQSLSVCRAAEAVKLMPSINTLLSDAVMLPAADYIQRTIPVEPNACVWRLSAWPDRLNGNR